MQFERRPPYGHLEPVLQRDVRALFRDYGTAQRTGLALLFQIADTQAISDACRQAAQMGLGWLESEEAAEGGAPTALQLHVDLVERLPPLLRVYVGCAAVLYRDWRNADLVRIHVGSGKLSLLFAN